MQERAAPVGSIVWSMLTPMNYMEWALVMQISFFFSSFDHEILREDAIVANVLIDVVLELKLNQKWIYYLA
jgi:hypothetical protein